MVTVTFETEKLIEENELVLIPTVVLFYPKKSDKIKMVHIQFGWLRCVFGVTVVHKGKAKIG